MSIVIEIGPIGAHVECASLATAKRAAALARVEHPRYTFTVHDLSRIPALQPVAQVGPSAGIRSALPECPPNPDGAERQPVHDPDSMLFAPASDSSAPPRIRHDFGGADVLLEIPAFLRRTADNRVPA